MAEKETELALLELARCFLEGPEEPPERVQPPATFRLRVWQLISTEPEKSKLHLTIEGLTAGDFEQVEVVFEGDETRDNPPKPWKGTELEFDLPARWTREPGPRFVTVYIREKGTATAGKLKKAAEGPKTIIRIVPAPVGGGVTSDFGDIEVARADDD